MQNSPNKSLFLVRTPLQYLNALEARYEFQIQKEDSILIFFTDYEPSKKQIKHNLNKKDWSQIQWIFPVSKTRFPVINVFIKLLGLLKIIFILFILRSTFNVFIGHIDDIWIRFLIKKIKINDYVLLEDGIATLSIAKRRHDSHNKKFTQLPSRNIKLINRYDFFERFFFRDQNLYIDTLTFFTVYNRINVRHYDKIIENKFSVLKSFIKKEQQTSNAIWFIGQPFVERGIISKEELLSYLNKIKEQWGEDYSYYYIAHRSGKKEYYVEEAEFRLLVFDSPIELVLTQLAYLPGVIGSFNSSALINLEKIFGPNAIHLFYVKMPLKVYLKDSIQQRIYNYFLEFSSLSSIS